MEARLVIADTEINSKNALVSVLFTDGKPEEIDISERGNESLIDNIYTGQIENASGPSGGWFVRFSEGENPGYLPFSENEFAIADNTGKDNALRPGSQVLVQVTADPIKMKRTRLSARLSIRGRLAVAETNGTGISFSKKLASPDKKRLKEIVSTVTGNYPFSYIIRTAAGSASEEELIGDIRHISDVLERVTHFGLARTAGSCLYKRKRVYLEMLDRAVKNESLKIITDNTEVYDEIAEYTKESPELSGSLSLYNDTMVGLSKLYKLSSLLEKCRNKTVWLPSGAFLVIEQTEAFVSIDVNTGKIEKKGFGDEGIFKVNAEAAAEIARQIRLRNLSGSILIDFINMKNAEKKAELIALMKKEVQNDPVKTTVIDITKLGIMEITRKKTRSSLTEQMKNE